MSKTTAKTETRTRRSPKRAAGCAPPACSTYWPLFKHMADNHGLTLLDSELEDICQVVESALEAMEYSQHERAKFTEALHRSLKNAERKQLERNALAEPA